MTAQLKPGFSKVFPENPTPRWVSPKFAAGFLLAVTALLFGRFLSPSSQQVLSHSGDLSSQFIWWRQFGFEELKKGHLALWNPHLFCGTPFFGGFQSALLYPPNWLFMFLPMAFTVNLIIALHLFLAGWFTYGWIRKRGSHPASALLAALMYMFSGAFFVKIMAGYLSNFCAMTWIPLIFLAMDGWRDDRRIRWVFLGAFAVALQIFSGHVQYVYYTAVVGAFYVLLSLPRANKKVSYLGGFILMYASGALLASVQLLTGWDAVRESIRSNGLSLGILSQLDMNTERLCCLFMPNFFGGWKDYWGGGIYCEGHPFVSVTGIVLALYSLKISSNPDKKIFAGMGLFLTLLMLGTRTPLFALFYKYFPLFSSFRGVSKLNILVVTCLAVLAALGLDEILKTPEALKGLDKATGWGSFVLGLTSVIFFLAPRMGGARLFKQFISHADEMAFHLLVGAFLMGVLAFLAYTGRRWEASRWGFLILALVELLNFAQQNLSSFDLAALKEKTASVIQETYNHDPGDYRVWAELGNYALGTSGSDIWGEDPMVLDRYARFASATQDYDFNQDILRTRFFRNISPSLGLLRLRYVFREKDGSLTAEKTRLKEVPRAYFVSRFQVLKNEEILQKTVKLQFDPWQEVLLERDPGIVSSGKTLDGKLTLRDINSDKIEIELDIPQSALLVISDNYSKGWRVEPISTEVQNQYQVIPANGFQRAIPLLAGHHHFYMEYLPALFDFGKWISIVSWICFFALLVLKRRSL